MINLDKSKDEKGGVLKSGGIKQILKRKKKDSEEQKELLVAAQASKHNRLKTDVLPEKNYDLDSYVQDQLLSTTR